MDKEIMRIVTMGSVDDGKSTLIGRLLYETNSIYEDQLKAVQVASLKRKMKDIDYSLLLDGLSSEREQGITIDVAHRYFETDRKRFIVADCPGHEQYTKNAFTGASVSNVGLILIDAEKGIREQSKRHCFISSLLGLSHLIFVINKMDLVNYSEEAYTVIKNEMILYLKKLNFGNYFFIPVSSIYGDNIVQGSCQMNWYQDNTVLDYLNTLTINNSNNIIDFRFPIQNVIRTSNFRGYAGKIVSGSIKLNEKIIILPSMKKTEVKDIIYNNKLTTGSSVILQLKDEIDISHGDMIVRENNIPKISNNFSCMICWMGEKSLAEGDEYILKQTTKKVNVKIRQVEYKLNIDTLHRESSTTLLLNDIGKVLLECDEDLFLDEYLINKETGSFILIDKMTSNTVAGGLVRQINLHQNKKSYPIFWMIGLSGSGKTTLCQGVEKILKQKGIPVTLLDGDDLRQGLCSDLKYTFTDRRENIRRSCEVAKLINSQGNLILGAFMTPQEDFRKLVKQLCNKQKLYMIYISSDISVCQQRDPKGLYGNHIINDYNCFEEPQDFDLKIETNKLSLNDSINVLMTFILERI